MKKHVVLSTVVILFATLSYSQLYAQVSPPPEGAGSRYIRIAEMGQLADTVNVLGNVGSEGRYIIPKNTSLPELMAFSSGFNAGRGRITSGIGGGKTKIQIKISRFNKNNRKVNVKLFEYRFDKPEPAGLYEYDLKNSDVISVEVRRKPSFGDYVSVIAPVISTIATAVLLFRKF